jgi:hypothetical protein
MHGEHNMMTREEIIEEVRKEIAAWPTEDQSTFFFAGYNEFNLIELHHTFGTHIRNKYKLWENKWEPELRNGSDYSPNHPDNLSMEIIKEAWRRGPIK